MVMIIFNVFGLGVDIEEVVEGKIFGVFLFGDFME